MTSALVTWLPALMAALLARPAPTQQPGTVTRAFSVGRPSEVLAVIHAGCARCDWGETGREAAVLRLSVDGTYSQHLFLSRGEAAVDYRVRLGTLTRGPHELRVERDAASSARAAGPATIDVNAVVMLPQGTDDNFTAQSMAPILYARPNTVGVFTDLPLLMWYEVEPTPRGRRFSYSVIFSNEDGGTETDRLMATWGRTTDIEFVYGVEIDAAGRTVAEEFQGPGHEVPPFTGKHEGRHPLLWVSTDNNMVSESGPTRIRYAPEAARFDLTNVSREAVMDANPWTYAVASAEMRREGKIADDPPPGRNAIADPRRFVYVEACGQVGNAALAVSIGSLASGVRLQPDRAAVRGVRLQPDRAVVRGVRLQPDLQVIWTPSDRGLPQYRITRDGCFRSATPVPAGTGAAEIRALRLQAFERPPAAGAPPVASAPVRLMRINTVFMLDDHFRPGRSILTWEGPATIRAGGEPLLVWAR